MLAHVATGTVHGVEPVFVRVEVNLSSGLPAFTVVGLPHGAVRESRERVAAALRNSGFDLPHRRITVNLAPGDLRKEGTGFDLPVALGVLAASGALAPESLDGVALLGELGLDGALRPVPGVLPVAAELHGSGRARTLVVPGPNGAEAALVEGLRVVAAPTLSAVVEHLRGVAPIEPVRVDPRGLLSLDDASVPDLRDVRGQQTARRALEIAAAGVHNLLFVGPPGSGKTMLALRLPGILPPLSLDEALASTRVHSVAGLLSPDRPLVGRPPFRAPHHSVSEAGLVGGGAPLRPGEISLAHRGVLFLDELPEFRRSALEILRQPLEEGRVRLARANGGMSMPARFLLVAAMNPCPCGYLGDGSDRCLCDEGLVARYRGRVSGPLMDRIDLQVQVPAVAAASLRGRDLGEPSAAVRDRVLAAREIQRYRLDGVPGAAANGHMGPAELRRFCGAETGVDRLMAEAVERMGLSARGYHRVLRVARTIADLEGSEEVRSDHAAEALQYRARSARATCDRALAPAPANFPGARRYQGRSESASNREIMRLFIALNLPKKGRTRIHRASRGLRETEMPVRWVDPDHYHVTLKFLGQVRKNDIPRVEEAMAKAAGANRPFTTELGGFGAFPTVRRPRVIWLGVGANPELRCLKQDLEWSLGDVGFESETRAFHPHVTLGRADERGGAGAFRGLDELVAAMGFSGEIRVHTLDLMSSHVSKDGARYAVVSSARLTG